MTNTNHPNPSMRMMSLRNLARAGKLETITHVAKLNNTEARELLEVIDDECQAIQDQISDLINRQHEVQLQYHTVEEQYRYTLPQQLEAESQAD